MESPLPAPAPPPAVLLSSTKAEGPDTTAPCGAGAPSCAAKMLVFECEASGATASSTRRPANSSGCSRPLPSVCRWYKDISLDWDRRESLSISTAPWNSSQDRTPSWSASAISNADEMKSEGTSQILAMRSNFFRGVGPGKPMQKETRPGISTDDEISSCKPFKAKRVLSSQRTNFRASKQNCVATKTFKPASSNGRAFSRSTTDVAAVSQPSPGWPSGWPAKPMV
mmetsp:Transcript_1573/g.6205  ORF Transcript_1573/g.6205 Transcript_1573/m.6205 type:complete len:226 (-) Transcript_1573:958-1635(-)